MLSRLFVGVFVSLVLASGLLLAAPNSPLRPSCAEADSTYHVALVIELGSGQVVRSCVGFSGSQVTGTRVMQLSRVQYSTATYSGLGSAVCQIDSEPASFPPSCWTASSPYWAMFVSRGGGAWSTSSQGVSSQTFKDGDALGWHYIPQSGPGGGPPPSPDGVCPSTAGTPTPPSGTAPPGPTSQASGTSNPQSSAPVVGSATTPAGEAAQTPEPSPTDVLTPTPLLPSPTAAAVTAGASGHGDPRNLNLNPGWLLAAAGMGALGGLLVLQLLWQALRR